MRILVTGADGFLGSAVMRSLRSLDAEVVPVTRSADSTDEAVVCDLGVPASLCRLLEEVAPECIVNIAAVADFASGVLPFLYPVNTLCPALMAQYCRENDAHLVFASMAVHGRHSQQLGPDTSVRPKTDYGLSKWLAEQCVVASGCRSAVIRFGGIFGPTGPDHLGINRAIRQARAGRVPTMVGTGSTKRNYLYVEDAAGGVRSCVTDALTGVFYAAGETQSMRNMLQAICDVWLPGQVPEVRNGEDAPDQLVDASPELGPVRTFREALEHAR